ncbi:macro domain-containing protein [Chlamydia crocodili]|uniref:Macro domain-containing protein n=1 Tax=Chlamydia crocodili TaxID=2766982 RepID=A0ABX8CD72_9CHLA|nr:macro domain-containing protein [Chlamydia crocodili]QVE48968.1 macro domain-containing protein [Chlamydia crocodili]
MSQLINTQGSSHPIPGTPFSGIQRSQNKQGVAKRVALATVAALSLVGFVTTLALTITLSMPPLAAAVVIFSIIAVVCCVLLRKTPTRVAPLPQPIEEGTPEHPGLTIPEFTPEPSLQPVKETEGQPSPVATPIETPTPTPAQPQDLPASVTQALPTDAPVSLLPIPSAQQLLDSWTQLPSSNSIDTPKFDPVDAATTFKGWKVPNTKTILVSTCGDITKPRFTTQGLCPMLVNAANDTMYRGGGGTNKFFTKAVSVEGWRNSTENKRMLQIGECLAGKWINADGTNNDSNPAGPALLAQLLGPMASQINNDPERCYQVVTQAYENCLTKALQKDSMYVQVPLISSSIYAPDPNLVVNGRNVRNQWIDAVKAALVTAVQNFATQNPNVQMILVVTDINNPPLG